MSAKIVALFVNKAHRKPMEPVSRITTVANVGIEGDRHAREGHHRSVLMMRKEDVDRFGVAPGDVREQVTTEGFDLYGPAEGTRVRVGDAVLELTGPCAPCPFMDTLKPGLREKSDGFRGRFASVVTGGAIGVGDALTVESAAGSETA